MIFISGVISIVIQKNTFCINENQVIYFCPNCVNFLSEKVHFFLFLFFFWLPPCNSQLVRPWLYDGEPCLNKGKLTVWYSQYLGNNVNKHCRSDSPSALLKKNLTRRRNRSIFYFGSGKNYAEWNIKILWSFQVCFDFLTLFHKFYRRLSPQKNYWFYKKMSYVMFIQKHYSRTSFIFILNIFC